jgi:hypothetical protein
MSSRTMASIAASVLLASSTGTLAANTNQGALAQGAPAGVKQAESFVGHNQLLWLVGGGVVIGGIVLVATGNGHGSVGTTCPLPGCTTTTTTNTSTSTPTTSTAP